MQRVKSKDMACLTTVQVTQTPPQEHEKCAPNQRELRFRSFLLLILYLWTYFAPLIFINR